MEISFEDFVTSLEPQGQNYRYTAQVAHGVPICLLSLDPPEYCHIRNVMNAVTSFTETMILKPALTNMQSSYRSRWVMLFFQSGANAWCW